MLYQFNAPTQENIQCIQSRCEVLCRNGQEIEKGGKLFDSLRSTSTPCFMFIQKWIEKVKFRLEWKTLVLQP